MKKTLLLFACILYGFSLYSQITEDPSISSRKSKYTSINSVRVNFLNTIITIDLRNFFINKPTEYLYITPEAYIEYISPSTGEIKREKVEMAKRWINSEKRFDDIRFGIKYNIFTDFGRPPVDWVISLAFPPLENKTNLFSLFIGYKGLYWKDIKIEETHWSSNWEEKEKELAKSIMNSKNINAGKYESLENGWPLAFIDVDNQCALINIDSTNPGWSIGDVWADLQKTANPNIYLGTHYISNKSERKVVVTFKDGIMSIKEGDNTLQYIKVTESPNTKDRQNQNNSINW